ncbi:MAG: hypothetical protein WAU01_07765, partial [Saprospiraceae bacterium]
MRFSTIIVFLILTLWTSSESIYGQCILEQLTDPSILSSGDGAGQQFLACESGILEAIEIKTQNWVTSPFTLHLKDASCNTIWTVTDIVGGPNQIINIDMSSGSGSTRTVINGELY